MGAPAEEATYREPPGWMDWYDTEESKRILKYRNRSYEHYSDQMRAIVQAMMAESWQKHMLSGMASNDRVPKGAGMAAAAPSKLVDSTSAAAKALAMMKQLWPREQG